MSTPPPRHHSHRRQKSNDNPNNERRPHKPQENRQNQNQNPKRNNSQRSPVPYSATPSNKRPRPSTSSTIPTNLDIVTYSLRRTRELSQLRKHLNPSKRQTKRVYQQLSWHARRRTMSHTSRRTPSRLRFLHARELTMSQVKDPLHGVGKKKLRKYKGRARFLKVIRRLRLARYSECHVWHAKRFHMREIHPGVKVAWWCNDRGGRSMYRGVNNGCLVHDASYTRIVTIPGFGNEGLIRSVLGVVDGRRVGVAVKNGGGNGGRIIRGVMIRDFDGVCVCSVDVIVKGDWECVWLFIRPESLDDCMNILSSHEQYSNLDIKVLNNEPLKFTLYGPLSENIIMKFIDLNTFGNTSSRNTKQGTIIQTTFKHTENSSSTCASSPELESLWNEEDRERLSKAYKPPKPHNSKRGIKIPIWLIQTGNGKSGEIYGWDVIVPKGWGMPVWRDILQVNHKRAIGLKDIHGIQQIRHKSLSVFPEDFIDCSTVRQMIRDAYSKDKANERKKPKGKMNDLGECVIDTLERLCDEKEIKIARGFHEVQEGKGGVVGVLVKALGGGRGVPARGAVIRFGERDMDCGVVMTGGYSLGEGCGVGRGFVSVDALKKKVDVAKSKSIVVSGVFKNCAQNSEWRKIRLSVIF